MGLLKYKNIELNTDAFSCKIDNTEISLTKYEYLLLKFLITNPNKIFSRQELINEIWESKVSNRTVDTTISRLRKKLGNFSKYLTTRFGFGYGILEK